MAGAVPAAAQGVIVRRILFGAALVVSVASLAAFTVGATDADSDRRVDIDAFMTGLACIESGGRFHARNDRSGAIGKYQIMPRNWAAWSARYLGNRWARPTPRHQEFVARQRILALQQKHGSWRRVAHWWLTGDASRDESQWSPKSTKYVDKVMAISRLAATPKTGAMVPERCAPIDYPAPKVKTEPFPRVRVTGGLVYLREAPGYEHRAHDVVRRGMLLALLAKSPDPRGKSWMKVGLRDGSVGWIASWFTEPR